MRYGTTDNPSQELIDEFVQECLVACPTLCKVIYSWEFYNDLGRFAHMRIFEAPHPGWVPPDRPAGSTGLDLRALGWTVRVGLRESIGRFVASEAVASASPWGYEYTETYSARAKIGQLLCLVIHISSLTSPVLRRCRRQLDRAPGRGSYLVLSRNSVYPWALALKRNILDNTYLPPTIAEQVH